MKAQLLQDIGESHTTAQAANANANANTDAPPTAAAALPPPMPRSAPRVWSKRVEPVWSEPVTQPLAIDPVPVNAGLPDFAGGSADNAPVPPPARQNRLDRWGRLATWGAMLLLATLLLMAALLAGGAYWLNSEREADQTISALAKDPLPAVHDPSPVPATPPALPDKPAAAQASATPPTVAEAPRADIGPPPRAPAAVPQPTSRKLSKKTAPSGSEPVPDRAQLWSETLKLCRAAGYHAARCAKLGCTATKFGLSCKGSPR